MKSFEAALLLLMPISYAITAAGAEDAQASAPYEFRLHNATDFPLHMIIVLFRSGQETWDSLEPGACSEYRAVESAHIQIPVTAQNSSGERYELFFRDPGARSLEPGRYTYSLDTVIDNFPRRLIGRFFQEEPRPPANLEVISPCSAPTLP